MMKSLLYAVLATCATAAAIDSSVNTQYACQLFSKVFPSQTFYTNSTEYQDDNTDYYTSAAWLGPACIFQPSTTAEMSFAIKSVSSLKAPFAIRGGGHMPIADAANIGPNGVLISNSRLITLTLSSDKKSVSIGPGNDWTAVQNFLKPEGLAAVGGRVGLVGVPGYTLGGGISFYGNQHGFTSANVLSYECVLHDGSVVTASETSNPDLFWALKGGGNSLAIVTRFDMKVYSSPSVNVGLAVYPPTLRGSQYIDAVTNFVHDGANDDKAAVIPNIIFLNGSNTPTYQLYRFYDSVTEPSSNVWENFTEPKMTPAVDTYSPRHISTFLELEQNPAIAPAHGAHQKFHVLSSLATKEAFTIAHKALLDQIPALNAKATNIFTSLTIQPITKKFLSQSLPLPQFDKNTVARGPYFWYVLSVTWFNPGDDATVNQFAAEYDRAVTSQFRRRGLDGGFLYMNDADKGQKVFESYPRANLERLKAVREKFDPQRVFTDLMPGGWKIATAR